MLCIETRYLKDITKKSIILSLVTCQSELARSSIIQYFKGLSDTYFSKHVSYFNNLKVFKTVSCLTSQRSYIRSSLQTGSMTAKEIDWIFS